MLSWHLIIRMTTQLGWESSEGLSRPGKDAPGTPASSTPDGAGKWSSLKGAGTVG